MAGFEGIDSSDYEDVPLDPRLQPRTTAGQKMADKFKVNRAADRTDSKRIVRNLSFIHGTPSTTRRLSYAANVFDAYLETLGLPSDTCPTGETICRFLITLVKNIQTNLQGKHTASLSTVQKIWDYVNQILVFRYKDLSTDFGEYEKNRMKVFLDQQVTTGALIKGTWVQKQWLGFAMISKMARAYVEDGLDNGCLSWDLRILRLLGVVLQCACNSRPGDIARSDDYTGLECLLFEHIELTLIPDGVGVQDLRGKVTLTYTKGLKFSPHENKIHFFDPLVNSAQSTVCVIKLLLVHGLRHGYVHGCTIEEVIAHTAARPDRTVQWKTPQAPVLCQMRYTSGILVLDRPAPQRQLNFSIQKMATVAGILEPVSAMSIRNGAARDVAHLGDALRGIGTATAARALGHKVSSHDRDITDNYIGPMQETIYNLRAAQPFDDRLAPAVTTTLTETGRKKRRLATPRKTTPASSSSASKPTSSRTSLSSAKSHEGESTTMDTEDGPTCDPATLDQLSQVVLAAGADEVDIRNTTTVDGFEASDDNLIDILAEEDLGPSTCCLPGDEFVAYFARINIFRNMGPFDHTSIIEISKRVATGHSRDEPRPFLYHCDQGECDYTSWNYLRVEAHSVNCKGVASTTVEKPFACTHPECQRRFVNDEALQRHNRLSHQWIARECEQGCEGVMLNTYQEYNTHWLRCHDEMDPQQCPLIDECGYDATFDKGHRFRNHLLIVHHLTNHQIAVYMPNKTKEKFASPCPIKGCKSVTTFTAPAYLRQHLVHSHKKSQEEAEAMVPLNGLAKRAKAKKATQPASAAKGCPIQGCKSKAAFPSPSMLKRHLVAKLHRMNDDDAQKLAEDTFGKTMGKARKRSRRDDD